MFGYVLLNAKSASEEEKKRYTLYYCGLCKALEKNHGRASTKALSYDMTFLYMLLADLYNQEGCVERERCTIHPVGGRDFMSSPVGAYCADMQLLLAWYSARDKVRDGDDGKAAAFLSAMEAETRSTEDRYPRQARAIRLNLDLITKAELDDERDVEIPSGYFASLMGEIFAPREDQWYSRLSLIGQGLGRFVYILDAWDDLEKDRKRRHYNPYFDREKDDKLFNEVREDLTIAASSAAEELERLPLDENLSILRNIIYSGIWTKFDVRKHK